VHPLVTQDVAGIGAVGRGRAGVQHGRVEDPQFVGRTVPDRHPGLAGQIGPGHELGHAARAQVEDRAGLGADGADHPAHPLPVDVQVHGDGDAHLAAQLPVRLQRVDLGRRVLDHQHIPHRLQLPGHRQEVAGVRTHQVDRDLQRRRDRGEDLQRLGQRVEALHLDPGETQGHGALRHGLQLLRGEALAAPVVHRDPALRQTAQEAPDRPADRLPHDVVEGGLEGSGIRLHREFQAGQVEVQDVFALEQSGGLVEPDHRLRIRTASHPVRLAQADDPGVRVDLEDEFGDEVEIGSRPGGQEARLQGRTDAEQFDPGDRQPFPPAGGRTGQGRDPGQAFGGFGFFAVRWLLRHGVLPPRRSAWQVPGRALLLEGASRQG
jgi:hypothetical protein